MSATLPSTRMPILQAQATMAASTEQHLRKVLDFIVPLSGAYPNIDQWYETNVVPGFYAGTRKIVAVKPANQILALGIAKKEPNERKICTLRVSPGFRGQGIGTRVLEELMEWLGTCKPLITVPEENIDDFEFLIRKFGFRMTSTKHGIYRLGKQEYYFNEPSVPPT